MKLMTGAKIPALLWTRSPTAWVPPSRHPENAELDEGRAQRARLQLRAAARTRGEDGMRVAFFVPPGLSPA